MEMTIWERQQAAWVRDHAALQLAKVEALLRDLEHWRAELASAAASGRRGYSVDMAQHDAVRAAYQVFEVDDLHDLAENLAYELGIDEESAIAAGDDYRRQVEGDYRAAKGFI